MTWLSGRPSPSAIVCAVRLLSPDQHASPSHSDIETPITHMQSCQRLLPVTM
jgi:hypothetical protein